jgi:hypothetical protein
LSQWSTIIDLIGISIDIGLAVVIPRPLVVPGVRRPRQGGNALGTEQESDCLLLGVVLPTDLGESGGVGLLLDGPTALGVDGSDGQEN